MCVCWLFTFTLFSYLVAYYMACCSSAWFLKVFIVFTMHPGPDRFNGLRNSSSHSKPRKLQSPRHHHYHRHPPPAAPPAPSARSVLAAAAPIAPSAPPATTSSAAMAPSPSAPKATTIPPSVPSLTTAAEGVPVPPRKKPRFPQPPLMKSSSKVPSVPSKVMPATVTVPAAKPAPWILPCSRFCFCFYLQNHTALSWKDTYWFEWLDFQFALQAFPFWLLNLKSYWFVKGGYILIWSVWVFGVQFFSPRSFFNSVYFLLLFFIICTLGAQLQRRHWIPSNALCHCICDQVLLPSLGHLWHQLHHMILSSCLPIKLHSAASEILRKGPQCHYSELDGEKLFYVPQNSCTCGVITVLFIELLGLALNSWWTQGRSVHSILEWHPGGMHQCHGPAVTWLKKASL